ncbi:formate/nitrite transporter family protein [Bosea sp. (in: a-proteobacteria)]|uniref:formate/nitrite transporter family protein n=1 Tax=Bosea sp. (in: a-proteobacteria) TaxID=1871050 RepID=UPI003B3A04C6
MSGARPAPGVPAPPELKDKVFDALAQKSELPLRAMIVLGLLAGAYIGFGGLFAIIALTGAESLPYGFAQIIAGLVFATGLGLVIIAGAELFTGNTMMIAGAMAGRIAMPRAFRALAIVYLANLAGSLMLAALAYAAGLHEARGGAVGRAAVDLARGKTEAGFLATLASGVLANMLVCLAVWCAYAGETVTEKLAGLVLPVAAFVAAGLEHSVANMFLLPYAWLVQAVPSPGEPAITTAAIVGNLLPATLGNIVGGAVIAASYLAAFGERAATSESAPGQGQT